MRPLTPAQLGQLIERFQHAARDGDTPAYRACHARLMCPVILNLPLGEMLNPAISGFAWAWAKLGSVSDSTRQLRANSGISAQGLEPLLAVQTDLAGALLVASEIGVYRLTCWLDEAAMRRLGLHESTAVERDDEEDEEVA